MKVCEICKKEESEWQKNGAYPFMFVFTVKTDDKEHFVCPECTYKRLEELGKKGVANERKAES